MLEFIRIAIGLGFVVLLWLLVIILIGAIVSTARK